VRRSLLRGDSSCANAANPSSSSGLPMKITEDVRKFAAEQKISENEAFQVGLEEKAKGFVEKARRFTRKRKL